MSLYSTVTTVAAAAATEVATAANNYDINDAANITNCAPINVAAPVSVASAATVNFSPSQRNSIETFQIDYLVQLIEHPILRIPNILFVYFLSIFSR